MNLPAKLLAAMTLLVLPGINEPVNDTSKYETPNQQESSNKIQAAILLDVSGSMQGLIEQAKALLWNMVITLGKAQCADKSSPTVELALYEYGRINNDAAKGYIKQLSPFTSDLDEVSRILFSLTARGSEEYCGQVIYTSMDELAWDTSPVNYKVIFIAGNEDFLQGKLHYTKACDKAKEKGVIVNTIYCGDYQTGVKEHWNLAGECGNGSFSNIDQNAKELDIPTPYDTTLIALNSKINNTYIGFGDKGYASYNRQKEVDEMNFNSGNNMSAKRIEAKSKSKVYNNSSWDLVDAQAYDSSFVAKVDLGSLPDSLKNKTREQIVQIVKEKSRERKAVQDEIMTVSANRSKYIADQRSKMAATNNEPTLESAVDKIIKEQVKRYNMTIE